MADEFNMNDPDVVRHIARALEHEQAGRTESAELCREYCRLASVHTANRDALRAVVGTADEDDARAAVKASGRELHQFRSFWRAVDGRDGGPGITDTTTEED